MNAQINLDRMAPRDRPEGEPVMRQNWENFLFLSWPIDPTALRTLVPRCLELDRFDGETWISITPFRVTGLRVMGMDAGELECFHEVNFRTYVHHNGRPGIWFLSLDASKLIPAVAARVLYGLPYHDAEIDFRNNDGEWRFTSRRVLTGDATFHARWQSGRMLPAPKADSLSFFLAERYCSYAGTDEALSVTQIHHSPWVLHQAQVATVQTTFFRDAGLPEPSGPPVAYASQQMGVDFWPPLSCR